MAKQPKKITTNDNGIDKAERKLDFKYPEIIRQKLKERNGFEWGGFRFYPVIDEEDVQHTFDDVVRENTNPTSGWEKYIPKGYVCIADSDNENLLLNKNKDGKIYYHQIDYADTETFEAVLDEDSLAEMLDENDLFIKLNSPADSKYFIKLLIYSMVEEAQFTLLFHKNPNLDDPKKGLAYCSKVNPGQTLTQVIQTELTGLVDSDKWQLHRIYDGGTDFDRHGNELVRYNIVIQVDHFNTKGKRFKGLNNAYMSWVDESVF